MDDRDVFELWHQCPQAAIKCISPVRSLFEGGSLNRRRMPAITVEGQIFMGLYFDAKDAGVWDDDDDLPDTRDAFAFTY